MATKRLARTINERGNYPHFKMWKKEETRKQRRAASHFCRTYHEHADTEIVEKVTPHYYCDDSAHKHSALRRYLLAHLGMKWDYVYGKISRLQRKGKYDIKTYVKGMVQPTNDPSKEGYYGYLWGFYVEQGILKYKTRIRSSYNSRYNSEAVIRKNYVSWIGERAIELVGSVYFWKEPIKVFKPFFREVHIVNPSDIGTWNEVLLNKKQYLYYAFLYGYRQSNPLSSKEIGYMEWLLHNHPKLWQWFLSPKSKAPKCAVIYDIKTPHTNWETGKS